MEQQATGTPSYQLQPVGYPPPQAGPSFQQQPAGYPPPQQAGLSIQLKQEGYTQPMNTVMIHPLLPANLWPHNFLILSIFLAFFLFIFGFSMLGTIPASITAYLVSDKHELEAALLQLTVRVMRGQ